MMHGESMSTESGLLEIKGLHAGIGGTEILKGIDLKIDPGEIHAIMEGTVVEKLLRPILSWDIQTMK